MIIKKKHKDKKKIEGGLWTKVVAVLFISLMIAADFYAMFNLFQTLRLDDVQSWVLSGIAALLLDGNPAFLGIIVATLADDSIYNKNDKKFAWIGFIIAIIGIIGTMALTIAIRVLLIIRNAEYSGGYLVQENKYFIRDVFLTFLPILTSIFAFVASWVAFGNYRMESLGRKVTAMRKDLLEMKKDFVNCLNALRDAKQILWTTLSIEKRIPSSMELFRKECYFRIKGKLKENTKVSFPVALKRYNAAIEGELENYIKELCRITTLDHLIGEFDVAEIIKNYDEMVELEEAKWNLKDSEPVLINELNKMIDNAVIIAQTKVSTDPYYTERRR